MPKRGSLTLDDLVLVATSTGAAFGLAWFASLGGNIVFADSGLDGSEPSESNWHGKFW
jgi:hypothetical protein